MKRKTRLTALFLLLILVVSILGGCVQKKEPGQTTTGDSTGVPTSSSSEEWP